jgi:hypothetical protein
MPRNPVRRVLLSALTIASLAIAGAVYAAQPESQAMSPRHGHERTIQLVEASKIPQLTYVDLGKAGLTAGDQVVLTDGVNREDGSPAGKLREECTLTEPGTTLLTSTFECSASIALPEGTIIFQGPFVPATAEQSQAVTGGTGEFRAADGEAILRAEDDLITIKLGR